MNTCKFDKREENGEFVYILTGQPIPLARCRFSKSGRVYDSQKLLKIHNELQLHNQHDERELFTGPLRLTVTFFMEMPKVSNERKAMLNGKAHVARPDLSNLIKFAEDIAIGVLYRDDSIIAEIVAKKVYSMQPRTEFTLTRL